MPTPFYHLKIVQNIISSAGLEDDIKNLIIENLADFMYGNTAPDLQSLSGQAREETHFFTLPLDNKWRAEKEIFVKYPQLKNTHQTTSTSLFLAGYLCHLQADQNWIREIYWPFFVEDNRFNSLQEKKLFHDRLRTYLDIQAVGEIPSYFGVMFSRANPKQDLPFTSDEHLLKWHNYLSTQLQENGKILTGMVFAKRHNMSESDFVAPLLKDNWIKKELLSHLPKQILVEYHHRVIDENVKLLNQYIGSIKNL